MIEKLIKMFREEGEATTISVGTDHVIQGNAIPTSRVIEIVQEVAKDDGWIPCSERLPEENCEVLIAREKNKYEINMGYRTKDFWYDQCYHHIVSDVIAWMPLPTPYQKGE